MLMEEFQKFKSTFFGGWFISYSGIPVLCARVSMNAHAHAHTATKMANGYFPIDSLSLLVYNNNNGNDTLYKTHKNVKKDQTK